MPNRATLEELWGQATELPDATESPLAIAIIAEAMCEEEDCDSEGAAARVYQIARDCEGFASAIIEHGIATALTKQGERRRELGREIMERQA